MSGPYAEGWKLENPDDPDNRRVVADVVELPHVLVSEELLQRARQAFWATAEADRHGRPSPSVDAAVNAVAPYLWKAGYDAATKLREQPPRRPLPPGQVWAWIHDRVWDGKGEEPPGHYEIRGTGALLD